MQAALTSLHTLATLIFVGGSALVGTRLVLLARRTGQAPELLLGSAILLTAVFGYGVLIANLLVRGLDPDPASVTPLAQALSGAGKSLHDLGVVCFLVFVLRVFRPGETWARLLAGLMIALLGVGLLGQAVATGFRTDAVGSAFWLCEYLVIWTYPFWLTAESLRWWRLMRRRVALGLADPLVTNRFLLWGLGSVFTLLAIWIASVPYLLVSDVAAMVSITPAVRVATAVVGLASISCSYLAFLPPGWYARRVRAAAAQPAAAG